MTAQSLISRYNNFDGATVSHATLKAFHHDLQRHIDSDGHGPYAKELKGILERTSAALKRNFDMMTVQITPISVVKKKPVAKVKTVVINRPSPAVNGIKTELEKLQSTVKNINAKVMKLQKDKTVPETKPPVSKKLVSKPKRKKKSRDVVPVVKSVPTRKVKTSPVVVHQTRESNTGTSVSRKKKKSVEGLPTQQPGTASPGLPKNLSGVVSAEHLAGLNFKEIELDGTWKTDLHRLFTDTQVMGWGSPGSGKTVKFIQLGQYLAEKGYPVLYVANEELGRSTFTIKMREFKFGHANLHFTKDLPEDLTPYAVIFLDSVQTLGMDLKAYKAFRKANPDKLTVAVIQSTKDGDFKGGNDWEHEMDIAFEVVDRQIVMHKNRLDPEFAKKAEKIKIDNMVDEKTKKAKINQVVKNKMIPSAQPIQEPQLQIV